MATQTSTRQFHSQPRTMNSDQPSQTSVKRASDESIEIIDVRETKKARRLVFGSISVPKNDPSTLALEEGQCRFYTLRPLDKTEIDRAIKQHYLSHVIWGGPGNSVIQALVEDKETKVPWTVPKVTVEFKRIYYVSENQPYTQKPRVDEGEPISPTAAPTIREMRKFEYEQAVEHGDPRLARCSFECFDEYVDLDVQGLCGEVDQ